MRFHVLSSLLICTLVATQVIGPATLWAAEERSIQIDESRRVVLAAVDGAQLAVRSGSGSKPVQFRDVVNVGEYLTTGDGTMAELLIGNRAVVTMGNDAAFQLLAVSPEQTTIQVTKGMVRVAAAASALGPRGVVTVQTPTGQVQTRGGIVRVWIEAQMGKAESVPMGKARPYKAAYAPDRLMVASETPQSELIQVEEGAAEILGAGGKTVTIQTGQSVTLRAGETGDIGGGVTQDSMRPGVVATEGHNQMPKEGRDYLVALQIDQATQLGKLLIDPTKTGPGKSRETKNPADPDETRPGDSEKKSDMKDVINGATGGVPLVNSSNGGSRNLVDIFFGTGRAGNPTAAIPLERQGNGHGGINNNGSLGTSLSQKSSVFLNNPNALLAFTRKDPIEIKSETNDSVVYGPLPSVTSDFRVAKELILTGGTPNEGHGGTVPTEWLIIRGLAQKGFGSSASVLVRNDNFTPTEAAPSRNDGDADAVPDKIGAANSTFVVENTTKFSAPKDEDISDGQGEEIIGTRFIGGTLGQYSRHRDPRGRAFEPKSPDQETTRVSLVDGAITATTDPNDPNRHTITLKGGVSLDQGTIVTIGTTTATDNYFKDLTTNLGRTFSGSLLSVIKGPNSTPTVLTMQDRMLGVYDGSTIKTDSGSKALLSVLDAKLKGPGASIPLIDVAKGEHALGFDEPSGRTSTPSVRVTTAVVVRSAIPLPLDGALLEASAPLFALTQAMMTTTNHFADLAGNKAQSMNLGDALVTLNASKLIIDSGHLLNLNNATAAVAGYLFSLTNGSTLSISNGSLFSLNNGSSLTLNANAFGVFGSGTNTLSIDNNLCGAGATCAALVNSTNQPLSLNGVPLRVAGVTENVVVPNNFNVFAGNQAGARVNIGTDDALFRIDPTSTLTIKGTQVK